ncbi:MAG: hypothetical protein IK076_02615, partial [Bacteroidales bacterium]|nr:hypothetical protein [Bacteroidales bacterium]
VPQSERPLPTGLSSGEALSERLLHGTGVFITPGFVFGKNGEDYIRISLCAPVPVLKEALGRIEDYKHRFSEVFDY